MIDNCTESSRMMFALGASFVLFGLRFMLLRWRELDFAESRIRAAVTNAEVEIRRGISGLQLPVDSHELIAHQTETDDVRIVPARSDPPRPSL